MRLVEFVKQLPSDWVLAPIFLKGAKMASGKEASGKNPLELAFEKPLGPDETAVWLEKREDDLGAVGLFTGKRGRGIVILDVDRNLGQLQRKWGDSLEGAPVATSTRRNAAKFIFRVPEELWGQVSGFSHSEDHNEGYEVLWGGQGVIFGAYPGSKDGKAPVGRYEFEGDPEKVPDAPGWLIAEMKAAKTPTGFVKNRTALDLSDRTEDEVALIITECLGEIGNRGAGQREHWIRVGMAIHSVLPNELGLKLWSDWSKEDVEFADEWERGNPCEQPWNSFKPGRIGLGSLIYMADQVDPKRTRFTTPSKQILEAAEAKVVQEMRVSVLSHAEIVKQAKEILELDNPSEINHRMNGLAIAAGYRDRVAIEQLLLSQLEYERKAKALSWKDMRSTEYSKQFLIPDILPHPSVVVLYGSGGDGKSMTSWTLAKHIAMGIPFVVRGKLMPVQQGPVLILNGDQSEGLLKEQLEEVEMPEDAPVIIQQGWQLKRYNEFCRLIDQYKPAMVVIDSLIGCSSGDAFDENKSEFAAPLYWLAKNNGVLFSPTTIVIIHHANKTGGFRGTSAIRDAVDETWALKRPDQESGLGDSCRIIHIEKSRSGRGGTQLLMKMESDLTFSVSDFMPEVDSKKTTPDGIVDRVLMRIRTIYPRTVTRTELNADPLVGGKVEAIRKSIQRLEKKGLIEIALQEPQKRGSSPIKHYRAVLARGEGGGGCPTEQTPSAGTDEQWDKPADSEEVSHCSEPVGQPSEGNEACPTADPSAGAESGSVGQPDTYPRARTEDELNGSLDQSAWDD